MWEKSKSGLLVPEHHSVADWDIHGSLIYSLDNAIFVTAPSSLKLATPSTAGGRYPVLCRLADTLNIAQGRIETQFRPNEEYRFAFFFRQQSTLGVFDGNNTYVAGTQTSSTTFSIAKYVAGVYKSVGTWVRNHTPDIWYRERITWWKEGASLMFRYEYWNGAAWVTVVPDVTDNAPSFEGSATNRCGVGLWHVFGAWGPSYIDNTIIEWP